MGIEIPDYVSSPSKETFHSKRKENGNIENFISLIKFPFSSNCIQILRKIGKLRFDVKVLKGSLLKTIQNRQV